MELAAALGAAQQGGLIMVAISSVFTISYVANLLGEDEDWLHDLSIGMEPEDGSLWVYGIDEDGCRPSPATASIICARSLPRREPQDAGRTDQAAEIAHPCGAHRMLTIIRQRQPTGSPSCRRGRGIARGCAG